MNLTLVDVSCRPLEGKAQEMEFMYIKGRHVRCVFSRMPSRPQFASGSLRRLAAPLYTAPSCVMTSTVRRLLLLGTLHQRAHGLTALCSNSAHASGVATRT